LIKIKNVSKWYDNLHVLKDINEEVKEGQTVVVCGPSGSGKSTLLRCINGLEPYQKGEIIVDGRSLNDPKTNIHWCDGDNLYELQDRFRNLPWPGIDHRCMFDLPGIRFNDCQVDGHFRIET